LKNKNFSLNDSINISLSFWQVRFCQQLFTFIWVCFILVDFFFLIFSISHCKQPASQPASHCSRGTSTSDDWIKTLTLRCMMSQHILGWCSAIKLKITLTYLSNNYSLSKMNALVICFGLITSYLDTKFIQGFHVLR
jgi:hypothetical protein